MSLSGPGFSSIYPINQNKYSVSENYTPSLSPIIEENEEEEIVVSSRASVIRDEAKRYQDTHS